MAEKMARDDGSDSGDDLDPSGGPNGMLRGWAMGGGGSSDSDSDADGESGGGGGGGRGRGGRERGRSGGRGRGRRQARQGGDDHSSAS